MAKERIYYKDAYQLRVKPWLPFWLRKHPIFYDSALIFTDPEDAKAYTGEYIRTLVDAKMLNVKKPYEVHILTLHVYDPASKAQGMEDVKRRVNGL